MWYRVYINNNLLNIIYLDFSSLICQSISLMIYEIYIEVKNTAFRSFIVTFCSLTFRLKGKIVNLRHSVNDLLDKSEIFRTLVQ